jgi:CheY-like chemotaxis protein
MDKARILYVDDESDNLFAFKAVFRRHYHIQTAESGAEALALLEEQVFDLIISDQRMPQMTGVALLSEARERYPDMLRMVMTGYSDLQAVIDSINEGHVYHYIAKPWQAESLKVVLDNALEAHQLRMKNRALEKANILAQFEILKHQINPHFLFNSMNVLSSLILSQPQKALKFTSHFSRLYRSVLQLREQLMISLEEELEFVEAYITLQRIRFEGALQIERDLPVELMDYSLPPFSLQTVVENALKHNVVSEEHPLKVQIYAEGETLVVANNLQKRSQTPDSTGTGLENLRARYQLIGTTAPGFAEEGSRYVARLPLIPND